MKIFKNIADGEIRETDTFDTFFESWLLLDTHLQNKNKIFDENTNYWLPVDLYIVELNMQYCIFICSFFS